MEPRIATAEVVPTSGSETATIIEAMAEFATVATTRAELKSFVFKL